MPRFAANLSLMFTEHAFLDRFEAAADAGFAAVECQFPYEHRPEAIAQRLARNGLTMALFNLPPGDWNAGEKGYAALPDRFDELKRSIETALPYVEALGTTRLHLMAGLAARDPANEAAFRRSIIYTAERLAEAGATVLIEPINPRDVPGYFLADFGFAHDLVRELALPNLKLQFDIYHCQIIHGDVTTRLCAMMPQVGHIQIASVPSRAEPGEELNYPFLFGEIDRLGYSGFVGCEYRPAAGTLQGLGWYAPYASKGREA